MPLRRTNAELRAARGALHDNPNLAHLVIQIDSTYARDCSTTWRAGWQRHGMRNPKRQPVKNARIFERVGLDTRVGTVEFSRLLATTRQPVPAEHRY
jgi:ribonuclease HI